MTDRTRSARKWGKNVWCGDEFLRNGEAHIHACAHPLTAQSIEIFGMLVTAVTTLIKSYAGGAEEYLIFFPLPTLPLHRWYTLYHFRAAMPSVERNVHYAGGAHCSAFGVVIARFGADLKGIKTLTASFVVNERSGWSGNTQK